MLEPNARATLTEQLRPPSGFQLSHAVATTFTLDLTTALSVPLAFAAHRIRESRDPIAILDAVRRAAHKIDVFAQAGQVFEPRIASDLFSLLEPMVHPVRAPKPGALFHPKVWVLEYTSGESTSYRMLCASRNLTNDRSWDLVVRLDGDATGTPTTQSAPLASFVRALPAMSIQPLAATRASRISTLATKLATVEWERPADVRSVRFHPYGVPGLTPEPLHELFDGKRHGIISPFITDDGIANIVPPRSRSITVLARSEQLDRLNAGTLARITAHVLDDAASDLDEVEEVEATDSYELGGAPDGEPAADGVIEQAADSAPERTTPANSRLSGLHAKAYVLDRRTGSHLFIGSANATGAAFGGNVEMLVEFEGPQPKIGVDAILGPDSKLRTLTVPYTPTGNAEVPESEAADYALEQALRSLAVRRYHARVELSGPAPTPAALAADAAREPTPATTPQAERDTTNPDSAGYRIHLTADEAATLPEGVTARVSLLTRPANAAALPGTAVVFDNLALTDITPFLVIRATDPRGESASTVVTAALVGDIAGRQDAVIARQLADRESFMRLLALLLAIEGEGGGTFRFDQLGAGGDGWAEDGSGLFETLMKAIGADHSGLADLQRIIEHVRTAEHKRPTGAQSVLPDGFTELWEAIWASYEQTASDDRAGRTTKRTSEVQEVAGR